MGRIENLGGRTSGESLANDLTDMAESVGYGDVFHSSGLPSDRSSYCIKVDGTGQC